MTGDDLRAAAAAAADVLSRLRDAAAPVPALGGSVADAVRHIAACLVWYAHDLAGGADESPGPQPVWPPDVPLPSLVREMAIAAEVLARVVEGASPGDRGWHPWGLSDPSGFSAIGAAEVLLHTADVADAVGTAWAPPAALAERLRDRLFPDAPRDADPWTAVRWATGRGDLPGRQRVTDWRYSLG